MHIDEVKFLYSQDLSNRKTHLPAVRLSHWFLYSQDLSNRKTIDFQNVRIHRFLYSQDLSNRKTTFTLLQQLL